MYNTITITFKNGNKTFFYENEWDDYSYDGSFFAVKKKGANIAMYNASCVFSVELE